MEDLAWLILAAESGPGCPKDGGKPGPSFQSVPRGLLTCGHHTEPSITQNLVSVMKLVWAERELQAPQWVLEHLS